MDKSAPLVGDSLSSAVEAEIEGDVIPSMEDDVVVNGERGASNDGELASVGPGNEQMSLNDSYWRCTDGPGGGMIELFGDCSRKGNTEDSGRLGTK